SPLPGLLVQRQLKRRGSKFVQCYGRQRPARYRRGWDAVRSVWTETPVEEKPAFKVYPFKRGAWPEMILGAVMGASRSLALLSAAAGRSHASGAADNIWRHGHAEPHRAPTAGAWSTNAGLGAGDDGRHGDGVATSYRPHDVEPGLETDGQGRELEHAIASSE